MQLEQASWDKCCLSLLRPRSRATAATRRGASNGATVPCRAGATLWRTRTSLWTWKTGTLPRALPSSMGTVASRSLVSASATCLMKSTRGRTRTSARLLLRPSTAWTTCSGNPLPARCSVPSPAAASPPRAGLETRTASAARPTSAWSFLTASSSPTAVTAARCSAAGAQLSRSRRTTSRTCRRSELASARLAVRSSGSRWETLCSIE
mmetsp:Transcript_11733/g.26185  ORF Transcript_11733/g.26185 Transcript_11733/m.26185 type:complete len:208 (+) Transcript_11733:106-729(+)